MTISGYSTSNYYNFSNYQSTGSYASTTSTSSTDQEAVQGAGGGPGGPGGPPPPPKGGEGKMQGPDLDTDSDGVWSTEELEEFATYASENMGINIDTENILTSYDTDGDGSINSDERVALGEDNAFNLPGPQEMMQQMRGFGPPPNIQEAGSTTSSTSTDTDSSTISAQQIQQFLEAYNQQNTELYEDMMTTSVMYEL